MFIIMAHCIPQCWEIILSQHLKYKLKSKLKQAFFLIAGGKAIMYPAKGEFRAQLRASLNRGTSRPPEMAVQAAEVNFSRAVALMLCV